jgi:hypothetical protein
MYLSAPDVRRGIQHCSVSGVDESVVQAPNGKCLGILLIGAIGGTDAGLLSRELAHSAKLTTFGGTDLVFAIGACSAE